MGKVKNKNSNEIEYLRGINKELRKENKALKRQVRDLQKHEHMYEELPEVEEEIVSRRAKCDECFKGYMDEIEFLGRVYATCETCGHRKKLKG